jgi:hypothetical protein
MVTDDIEAAIPLPTFARERCSVARITFTTFGDGTVMTRFYPFTILNERTIESPVGGDRVTPPVSQLRERLTIAMLSVGVVQRQTTNPAIRARLDCILDDLREMATRLETTVTSAMCDAPDPVSLVDDVPHQFVPISHIVTVWNRGVGAGETAAFEGAPRDFRHDD